jgi:hypothetical protein
MGKVQVVKHVQPRLPPAKDEDDCLSDRYDSLRVFRISWNNRTVRFDAFYPRAWTEAHYLRYQIMWINRMELLHELAHKSRFIIMILLEYLVTTFLLELQLRLSLDRVSSSIFSGQKEKRASLSALRGRSAPS